MKKHLDISICGKVQGVGFRYSVKEFAEKHQLKGYVRNMSDGTVTVEAEGDTIALKYLTDWLKSSPGLSNIESTEIFEGKIRGYREFDIY